MPTQVGNLRANSGQIGQPSSVPIVYTIVRTFDKWLRIIEVLWNIQTNVYYSTLPLVEYLNNFSRKEYLNISAHKVRYVAVITTKALPLSLWELAPQSRISSMGLEYSNMFKYHLPSNIRIQIYSNNGVSSNIQIIETQIFTNIYLNTNIRLQLQCIRRVSRTTCTCRTHSAHADRVSHRRRGWSRLWDTRFTLELFRQKYWLEGWALINSVDVVPLYAHIITLTPSWANIYTFVLVFVGFFFHLI